MRGIGSQFPHFKLTGVVTPGGGFILSSGNTIHSAVRPENYLAMLHTLKMFGPYPLSLDHWQGQTTDGFWT